MRTFGIMVDLALESSFMKSWTEILQNYATYTHHESWECLQIVIREKIPRNDLQWLDSPPPASFLLTGTIFTGSVIRHFPLKRYIFLPMDSEVSNAFVFSHQIFSKNWDNHNFFSYHKCILARWPQYKYIAVRKICYFWCWLLRLHLVAQ